MRSSSLLGEAALSLFYIVALAAASPGIQSAEAKAFTLSFHEAIACATETAGKASFEREQIDPIPREAVEACSSERDVAIQAMIKAIPDPDANLARDNVTAKMRTAAQERLIGRLESGETLPLEDESGFGFEKAGARYISCMRLAINHRLEG